MHCVLMRACSSTSSARDARARTLETALSPKCKSVVKLDAHHKGPLLKVLNLRGVVLEGHRARGVLKGDRAGGLLSVLKSVKFDPSESDS